MSHEINLFKKRAVGTPEFEKVKKILSREVVPILLAYAIFFAGIFGVTTYIKRSIAQKEKDQKTIKSQIVQYLPIEQMVYDFRKRISNINTILSRNAPFEAQIQYVIEKLGIEGIEIEILHITSDGAVELSFTARDSSIVDAVTNEILTLAEIGALDDPELSSAMLLADKGTYQMRVTFALSKDITF